MTSSSSPRIILGIDPGTNVLGYGIIAVDAKGPHFVTMGVFDLRKIKDPYEKLANIAAGVSELVDTYNPESLAVESPFLGKNAQVILKLGRAQGSAITAATLKGVPVFEYAPRLAKIAIAGNGAASKEQVADMLERTLGEKLDTKYLDATDALAIAMCHYFKTSGPLAGAAPSTSSGKGRKSSSGGWEKYIAENPERVK
ncbi:MAG: crossover junction endodeoxyribonuclease RuvC [Bacteroidales bacterium]|nr:crossover junction endodeoxyribonuclease RuvC [Bacteroidales bacterium]